MESEKKLGFLRDTDLSKGKAAGTLGIYIGGLTVLGLVVTLILMLLFGMEELATVGSWGNFITFAILSVIYFLMFRRQLAMDWRRIASAKKFLGGVFLGWFGVLGLSMIANIIVFMILGEEATAGNQELIEYLLGAYPLLLVIMTVFMAPFIEEIVFRLALMKWLERWPWLAITASSLVFGLIHVIMAGDYIFLISYAAMGFPMAFSYYKTGNIWYPIGIHFLQNFFAVSVMLFIG
ncbi:MAG: CPBP family intramembrane metalloprotease [Turicibacter sp.]|nr:CPBP family intramembrane metalloprotease [Turicibacter sp.]